MDIKRYLSLLEEVQKSASTLICEYCGNESISTRNLDFCSNCESIISTNRSMLEKKDHLLLQELESINRNLKLSNYDEALDSYSKIILEMKEPQFLYAASLASIKYSNHEITLISYHRTGFMDENTLHRDKSAKLISSSKKLLTKSIKMTKDEIAQGNTSLNLTYNLFLMEMKLGRMKSANAALQQLKSMGNEYIYNYALMAFESKMERYDAALKVSKNFLRKESFCVNALYYVALALFKKGSFEEARSLLKVLRMLMSSENVEVLIFECDAQLRN